MLALDEPLNHLDARGRAALVQRLKGERRPIVLVSHIPIEGIRWERVEL